MLLRSIEASPQGSKAGLEAYSSNNLLHPHPSLGLSSHQYLCSACCKEINPLTKSVALLSLSESMDTAAIPVVGDNSNAQDQETLY